ncbi:TraR/DksA C4-type zinc finger protein [Actinoplanes sp. NPDC023936]|uniref:TraR/DksA family transcriptional regulator n=1 Tax=Actinoplanes sp. NPDC023936 TaxID=3154910 RepID=UPI0033ED3B3E
MTATLHGTAAAGSASSLRLLRDILEEQFAVQTNRLTELVLCGELPRLGGYDPRTLAALTRETRIGVAAAADALRRMSQNTYGTCERCRQAIPLGRLHAYPEARYCTPCHQVSPS